MFARRLSGSSGRHPVVVKDTVVVLSTLISAHFCSLNNTPSEKALPFACVYVCLESLWLSPTTPALQFKAEKSWQKQKGFWDVQPYEFFIHFPMPTLALFFFLSLWHYTRISFALTHKYCLSSSFCKSAPGTCANTSSKHNSTHSYKDTHSAFY